MSYGFIIPTCCKNDIHFRQLLRCIESIQKFHPEKDIIIINDSDVQYDLKTYFTQNNKIHVIESVIKGSADQQTFKILLDTELFDKAIIMQDSMILMNKLTNIENTNEIKFILHFTNHRLHWNKIMEPKTGYNINNNIMCHHDLIKHNINKFFDNPFKDFALELLENKNKWCGCFGSACIIKKEHIMILNKTGFVDKFIQCTSNRDRRANESIFPLLCYYFYPNINFENSYEGLYYDGIKTNKYFNTETRFDNSKWYYKGKYFGKISFNR